jgi:3-oxoacyl-[acyl-carrier protein] reductase
MRWSHADVALAVVTGAGSGIGRASALALAKRGLDIALVGRTEATLQASAREVEASGVRVLVVSADVSSENDLRRAATAIAVLGVPRVVVNNAGVAGRKVRIEDTTESEWDHILDVNLKGVFLVSRAFLPAMRAAGAGRVVTIASISATLGTAGLAAYCASKWGALGFTKSLAEELRGSGLQAIAVLPGTVNTPMATVGGFPPQMTPEDVARVVVFAALDAPDAMNGASIECFGP